VETEFVPTLDRPHLNDDRGNPAALGGGWRIAAPEPRLAGSELRDQLARVGTAFKN
jgi:hypothetical protein